MKYSTEVVNESGGAVESEATAPREVRGHSVRRGTTANGRPTLMFYELQEDGKPAFLGSFISDDGVLGGRSAFASSRERLTTMLSRAGLLADGKLNVSRWSSGTFTAYSSIDEYNGKPRTVVHWIGPQVAETVTDGLLEL